MRRAAVVAVAMIVASGSGCSDEPGSAGDVTDALAYMPAEPGLVVIVDTDLDSEQIDGFEDTLGERILDGRGVEDILEEYASEGDLSYEDDLEPLLGGSLVVGFEEDNPATSHFVAALPVDDEDKVRDTLEKIPEAEEYTSVDDGVLVVATGPEELEAARERRDSNDGLQSEVVEDALRGLDDEALVKFYGDLDDGLLQLKELAPLQDAPWFRRLTTVGATISFDASEIRADALLSIDGVEPDELPVVSGASESPDVVRRDGWVSGANLDQSRATVFLLRTVRAAFPDSDFVRDVATVERERGIDFEREFLSQFNGPSQSLLTPGGRFAARSAVSNPERLATTMRKIYPDLGRLVEDLQGLESAGLAVLLLFAPDAPAATSVLGSADVKVAPLRDDLYRMSGLEGPGPDQIVFGLVGDVFVVAEDEQAAEEIATAPAEAFDGPPGPAVGEASGDVLHELTDRLGFGEDLDGMSRAQGSLEASPDGLRGRLVAEFAD